METFLQNDVGVQDVYEVEKKRERSSPPFLHVRY